MKNNELKCVLACPDCGFNTIISSPPKHLESDIKEVMAIIKEYQINE